MADNFNYKQFLMENRLGAYSKAGLNEDMQGAETTIPEGDEAAPVIKNPRNPREVAAAVQAQTPNIEHTWSAIATAAQPLMVAAFEAHGMDHEKATTATRILLGGSHSTYSDFPQELYDAIVGGGMEESQMTLDQDGAQVSETMEEGSNTVVIGSDDNFTTTIDGKEYKALYQNHDKGDKIDLVNTISGIVKSVSPNGDITIEVNSTNN
jgi:hypothetical protein